MATKQQGYSKRPLWHWILIYLAVGGLIYIFLYYTGVLRFRSY